ncbi:CoA-transferase [Variovorax sp. J22R133]|uniref:acyl CoA:acetate/3-ketoacid CoA transferase n=1 Tax=Variovorax brevis TaxID=3053503 RepID=UPI0025760475|nr:CoA-transferase [Variovorax sp. J22R133]MDM0111998.1 CoA-transferase [Variovorax sp. J22R133]
MKKDKIVSADAAIALIRDGDAVSCSGFVGIGTPEALIEALEKRFVETQGPRDLTLIFAAAPGDAKERGLNRLAHAGLVKRAIGGHWSLVPKLAKLATDNLIEAYNLPLGVVSHLYRDVAAHRAGSLSKVGMGTFVDPRNGGGKINARTTEDLVRVMDIDGEEWLFYKTFPVNVALIRGTTADASGNVTMEREALVLDAQAAAMAARNANGLVIAQVERIAATGSLDARSVVVPGVLVDCVVLAPASSHLQTYGTDYNAAFSGEIRVPTDKIEPPPLDERKLIARRCAFELPLGGVINLGIGVPEVVAAVAAEERVLDDLTLTAEPGVIGGMPQGGLDFGAAVNVQALLHQNQQFDFYDGGGLDLACLGMAEIDRVGNVNVSRFGPRLAGAGGFINISQNARRLIFAGTFTAGGLEVSVEDGKVRIHAEGKVRKFVDAVEQITFSGAQGAAKGQSVLYVTERCVFRLQPEGLQLIEVAPGIDVERDILAHMAFRPVIGTVATMDARIYRTRSMGLAAVLQDLQLSDRLTYDAGRNTLFVNFEGMVIRSMEDIESVRRVFEALCSQFDRKVNVIVNYDGFKLDDMVSEAYEEMVAALRAKYYSTGRRYSTSAFMRAKLGPRLEARNVSARIIESHAEARDFLSQRKDTVSLAN